MGEDRIFLYIEKYRSGNYLYLWSKGMKRKFHASPIEHIDFLIVVSLLNTPRTYDNWI